MLAFPIFNSARSPFPIDNVDLPTLSWILRRDPKLKERTIAARSGKQIDKVRLGVTCLGGPYRYLPPDANHGKCGIYHDSVVCGPNGYRNTQHVDWEARNGMVLVDIDNFTDDLDALRSLLDTFAHAATALWVSARGKGLKVGVAVDPVPLDVYASYDAWAAGYKYVVDLLTAAGLAERGQYRVDSTPAIAQMAILAYDERAVVREPRERVEWTPRERQSLQLDPRYKPAHGESVTPALYEALAPMLGVTKTPVELANLLPWIEGSRSTSMFYFGDWAAQRGFDKKEGRAVAFAKAFGSGMVEEYGLYDCLRHFDRGYDSQKENLLDIFPATGGITP